MGNLTGSRKQLELTGETSADKAMENIVLQFTLLVLPRGLKESHRLNFILSLPLMSGPTTAFVGQVPYIRLLAIFVSTIIDNYFLSESMISFTMYTAFQL